MEIGGSDSEVFFDDFEGVTIVHYLYVDQPENVYAAGMKMDDPDNEYAFPATTSVLWNPDPDGRIVLAASTELSDESYGGGYGCTLWKPQNTYFYYLSGIRE